MTEKTPRRVRKGSHGLYYTKGRWDNCDYNVKNTPFWHLVGIGYATLKDDDFGYLWETLCETAEALLYLVLLPILPIIRAIHHKKRVKDVKVEHFPKDYYEVLSYEEDYEEDEVEMYCM